MYLNPAMAADVSWDSQSIQWSVMTAGGVGRQLRRKDDGSGRRWGDLVLPSTNGAAPGTSNVGGGGVEISEAWAVVGIRKAEAGRRKADTSLGFMS
jgi:hypothetical protein